MFDKQRKEMYSRNYLEEGRSWFVSFTMPKIEIAVKWMKDALQSKKPRSSSTLDAQKALS